MAQQHMPLLWFQSTALLLLCGFLLVRWHARARRRRRNADPAVRRGGHGFDARSARRRLARVRANHSLVAQGKNCHRMYHEAAAAAVRRTLVRLSYFQSRPAQAAPPVELPPG